MINKLKAKFTPIKTGAYDNGNLNDKDDLGEDEPETYDPSQDEERIMMGENESYFD